MMKKRERHTPLNPPSMGEEVEQFPSVEGCRFRGEEGAFYQSSRALALFEGVRISSDTEGVILRLRFLKP